jgi:hypothetical protein
MEISIEVRQLGLFYKGKRGKDKTIRPIGL